ncbi:hypothetical protein [Nocardia sp. NPDC003963]
MNFLAAEYGSEQQTFTSDAVHFVGKWRGMSRTFRYSTPDAVVATHWPCCSHCLRRMRTYRWVGRALLACVPAAGVLAIAFPLGQDFFFPDGGTDLHRAMMYLVPVALWGFVASRVAFSNTRPIREARLNDDRTAMIVSAVHPDYVAALADQRQP